MQWCYVGEKLWNLRLCVEVMFAFIDCWYGVINCIRYCQLLSLSTIKIPYNLLMLSVVRLSSNRRRKGRDQRFLWWWTVTWIACKYAKWFFCFEVKWNEVKWVTLRFWGAKVQCTLRWPCTEGTWLLWLFYLVCIWYCGCFNLFCNVWLCGICSVWVCVCVGL